MILLNGPTFELFPYMRSSMIHGHLFNAALMQSCTSMNVKCHNVAILLGRDARRGEIQK